MNSCNRIKYATFGNNKDSYAFESDKLVMQNQYTALDAYHNQLNDAFIEMGEADDELNNCKNVRRELLESILCLQKRLKTAMVGLDAIRLYIKHLPQEQQYRNTECSICLELLLEEDCFLCKECHCGTHERCVREWWASSHKDNICPHCKHLNISV